MRWLKLEDDVLVNLDHISCAEILDMTPAKNNGGKVCHVVLYPANEDVDSSTACKGSMSKCEDYMSALLEFVGGKKICAIGEHQCQCSCGCGEIIREDFEICDDCREGYHWGNKEMVKEVFKKDAA